MNFSPGDRVLVNGKPATFHHGPVDGWCMVKNDGMDQAPYLVHVHHIKPTPPKPPHLVDLLLSSENRWSTIGMLDTGRPTVTVDLRVAKLAEVGIVVGKSHNKYGWTHWVGPGFGDGFDTLLAATNAAWEYAVGKGMVTR